MGAPTQRARRAVRVARDGGQVQRVFDGDNGDRIGGKWLAQADLQHSALECEGGGRIVLHVPAGEREHAGATRGQHVKGQVRQRHAGAVGIGDGLLRAHAMRRIVQVGAERDLGTDWHCGWLFFARRWQGQHGCGQHRRGGRPGRGDAGESGRDSRGERRWRNTTREQHAQRQRKENEQTGRVERHHPSFDTRHSPRRIEPARRVYAARLPASGGHDINAIASAPVGAIRQSICHRATRPGAHRSRPRCLLASQSGRWSHQRPSP